MALTPEEINLLNELYANVFTRWGDVQGETLISLRTQGLAFLYGPADLRYYAGFFEPASPLLEDQPVSVTKAGADAISQPWPTLAAHRDRILKQQVDKIRKK